MQINIIAYSPAHAADFKALNAAWLYQYGLMEPADMKMLDNPQAEILDGGGAIFLAEVNGSIAGTAALISEGNGVYELAKMSVVPAWQGKGISKLLITHCINRAKQLAATKLYLVSNSQLTTALALYEKYGFAYVPVTNAHYATADIMMELHF
ncbi:MAG: hypothetical protein RL172_2778 [Bacteroidota bacterium]|jgi:putative acetyltransferase